MAQPLARTWYNTLIDDDGSGLTGTIWNKAQVDALMDTVDASLAVVPDLGGAIFPLSIPYFSDADSLGPSSFTALGWGQLKWPSNPTPSTDPNALDCYQEGSWTPALTGSGGQSGQIYSTQIGRYIKIGKLTICWAYVAVTTPGTLSGNLFIAGLPYAAESLGLAYLVPGAIRWAGTASTWITLMPFLTANNAYIEVYGAQAATATIGAVPTSIVTAGTSFLVTVSYLAVN